jgi:hypothetical protein
MTSSNDFNLIQRDQRKHEKKTMPKGERGNRHARIAFMNRRNAIREQHEDDQEDDA